MSRRDQNGAAGQPAHTEREDQEAERPALERPSLKTRDERDEYDRRIGARLVEAGVEQPFRDRAANDKRPPHPQNRWIFPSIAYSRGGQLSNDFVKSTKGTSTSNYRLVTLRFGEAKPDPGNLAEHIERLSKAFNNVVSYLRRTGIAQPQLSAIHIRYDMLSGRLDPHLQGIWNIDPEQMSRAKELLRKYFYGVWIDEEKVRSLKDASFYICVGIFEHEAVADWPKLAILEAWRLPPRLHYVRPAGAFAEWRRTRLQAEPADAMAPESTRRATRPSNSSAPTSAKDRPHKRPTAGLEGAPPPDGSPRGEQGPNASQPPDASSSTASSPAPENQARPIFQSETRILPGTGGFSEIVALLLDLAKTQKR